MCKSEIFAKILRIVSKETEVSEDLILSKCKRSDIVDSRGIMVIPTTSRTMHTVNPVFPKYIGHTTILIALDSMYRLL